MTIQDLTPEVVYSGTGNVTVFSFSFEADESDDIFATVDETSDYSFSVAMNADQDTSPGGTVTFDTAPPNNTVVKIYRETDVTQETAYPPFNRFPAESHEKALDKLTMLIQELWTSLRGLWTRALVFPELNPLKNKLPTLDERKGKYFVFDGSGRPTVTDQTSDGVSGVQTIVAGINIAVNDTDPENPIISALGGDGGGVLEIQEGKNITVDATDPEKPIVSAADTLIEVHNATGSTLIAGKVVHPAGAPGAQFTNDRPNVEYAIADSHETIDAGIAVVTEDIPDGATGFVSNGSTIKGIDTSSLSVGAVYLSADVAGDVTNTMPEFPDYVMKVGTVSKVGLTDGEMIVSLAGLPADTTLGFFVGIFRERFDFLITSDGANITGSLAPSNGHPDLTAIFSDGLYTFTATPPATVALTAGTDTVPVTNYIYVPQSTKALTVSTTDWPTDEHIKICQAALQSAAMVQSDGALRNQNINDPVQDTITYQGHLSHITERIRTLPSAWDSGTEATLSVSPDPSDVYLAVTSGAVYQMHKNQFPALDMSTGDHVHVVNDSVSPYKQVTNLNQLDLDAQGDSLNNRWFSLVVWGVINKSGEESPVMINLPRDVYGGNNRDRAIEDSDGFTDYTIPAQFKGVGFLIGRFTMKKDGNEWIYDPATDYQDLRGFVPNSTAGGGAGGGGITEYLSLNDTPASRVGEAGKVPVVNSGETADEYGYPSTISSGANSVVVGGSGVDITGDTTLNSGKLTFVNPATPANTNLMKAGANNLDHYLGIYGTSDPTNGGSVTIYGDKDLYTPNRARLRNGTGTELDIDSTGINATSSNISLIGATNDQTNQATFNVKKANGTRAGWFGEGGSVDSSISLWADLSYILIHSAQNDIRLEAPNGSIQAASRIYFNDTPVGFDNAGLINATPTVAHGLDNWILQARRQAGDPVWWAGFEKEGTDFVFAVGSPAAQVVQAYIGTDGNVGAKASLPTIAEHLTRKDYVDKNISDAIPTGTGNGFTVTLDDGSVGDTVIVQVTATGGTIHCAAISSGSLGAVTRIYCWERVTITSAGTVTKFDGSGNTPPNGTVTLEKGAFATLYHHTTAGSVYVESNGYYQP